MLCDGNSWVEDAESVVVVAPGPGAAVAVTITVTAEETELPSWLSPP
jgi:hypothetical protein